MKRRWIITLGLFFIVPLLTCAVYLRNSTVPLDKCSELYRHYADSPGIDAAYIKDYRVNDTLTLCATLLEATTDSAWEKLFNTFSFKKTDVEDSIQAINKVLGMGNDALTLLRRNNQCEYLDSTDIAVASQRDKYICVFHTYDIQQNKALRHIIIDHIFSLLNNKQTINNKQS